MGTLVEETSQVMEWTATIQWLGTNFAAIIQAIASLVIAVATVRYVKLTYELLRAQTKQLENSAFDRNAPLMAPLESAIGRIKSARQRLAAPIGDATGYNTVLITADLESAINSGRANPQAWVRRKMVTCETMLKRSEVLLGEIESFALEGLQKEIILKDLGEKISSCDGLLKEVEADFSNMQRVLIGELKR